MLVCRGIVSSRLYRRCTARSIASANPVSRYSFNVLHLLCCAYCKCVRSIYDRVLPRGYTRSQGVLKRANPLPEQGFEKYGHSQVRPFGAHTTTYLCKGRRYAEALQTFYAKSDIFGATTLISSTTATGLLIWCIDVVCCKRSSILHAFNKIIGTIIILVTLYHNQEMMELELMRRSKYTQQYVNGKRLIISSLE